MSSLCLAVFAASLGLTEPARADFLIICPTATNAAWTGDAAGIVTNSQVHTKRVESIFGRDATLSCSYPRDSTATVEARVPNDRTCGGVSVRLTGNSAVFGRSEVFTSGLHTTEASREGDECVLTRALSSVTFLSLLMSEACERNDGDDFSWTCPDSAEQIPVFEQ